MKVIHTTRDSFRSDVLESESKVLLDFWAPWCGPCRMVSPVLDAIAAERPDIRVCKVNVDEEMELARQYKIFSIPTLIVMEGGNQVHKMVGAKTREQILSVL